jgi:hypothetical protein
MRIRLAPGMDPPTEPEPETPKKRIGFLLEEPPVTYKSLKRFEMEKRGY